jgi:transposase
MTHWKLKLPRDRQKLEERRIEAVRLIVSGKKKQAEIARELGVGKTRVAEWMRAYRESGGIRGLRMKPRAGRERFLTGKQHEKLRLMLIEGASSHGFDSDLWTCPRIQALILRKFGIQHGLSTIPRILRRLGFSPQKPEARAM